MAKYVGAGFLVSCTKALLRNKLGKAGDVIFCGNKAKNVDMAVVSHKHGKTAFFNKIIVFNLKLGYIWGFGYKF